MKTSIVSQILALGLLTNLVSAKGINCDGSGWCTTFRGETTNTCNDGDTMQRLKCFIDGADPNKQFHDGQHIAGLRAAHDNINVGSAVFVFPQKSNQVNGIVGWKLGTLMEDLVDYGCRACGSVPQGYSWGSNSPKDGILTVNYIWSGNGCEYI